MECACHAILDATAAAFLRKILCLDLPKMRRPHPFVTATRRDNTDIAGYLTLYAETGRYLASCEPLVKTQVSVTPAERADHCDGRC